MSSAVVALPKIATSARIGGTCAVSALAVLAGFLAPAPASAATSTVVGQGTYENTSSAVTMNGSWSTVPSGLDSGGSSGSLNSDGYAEISFKTSGIRWVTRVNSYSGIADVYLDGVKKTSVDLYSATTKTQQVVYEAKGLPETTHTLRIVRTGTKNSSSSSPAIMLDAFVAPDVNPPATPTGLKAAVSGTDINLSWSPNAQADLKGYRVFGREGAGTRTQIGSSTAGTTSFSDTSRRPGVLYTYDVVAVDTSDNTSAASTTASITMPISARGVGTYENDDPAVTLDGSWSSVTSTMDSDGSYASLNADGYAEMSFKTSGIRWVARKNSYSGIADVYVDGLKKTSVDLYSATTKYQQVAYEAKGLTETPHTLRIVRTGTRNASSTSSAITLDSFVAPDIYPPAAPTALTATAKNGNVQLGWTASPESDVIGYKVYRGGASGTLSAITSSPVTGATYLDDGLQPGSSYRYQVTALDAGGNESPVSAVVSASVAMKALPAGTYEDDDTDDITFQGDWTPTASLGANTDSGGSYALLSDTGYAELSFATSGVRWLARTTPSAGTADVYIDGVKKATVDLYSATIKYAQKVYEISGLSETGHTIRIVRTGDKNASSSGRGINVDAIVAPDVYAPSAPTAVTANAVRTGATVTWTKSPEADVASYRVFRKAAGSSTNVLVGSTSPTTTSLTDVGLGDGTSYTWTVVARDTSNNDSAPSVAAAFTNQVDPYASFPRRYASCPTATKTVSTRADLLTAIASATSGTVIRLNPGSYGARFDVATKATADKPMWICGPRSAVIDGGDISSGTYGFKVEGASNVVIAGMTVRNAQKGVAVISSQAVTVADLRLERIGDEAIHLKQQTTDSMVIGNSIDTTGLNVTNYGEGVYVGTANANLCNYNNCQPDITVRNVIAFNNIRNTTAEGIEAKGTTADGTIWKNTIDGANITASDADSLIQILGSGWVVAGTTGSHSPNDAIQVWVSEDGVTGGLNNIVYNNNEADTFPGYIVNLSPSTTNVVGCDNTAPNAGLGMTNRTCQN